MQRIECPDSLILLFAAAGFGLVALLMVLNLKVSAGNINGLIFYANKEGWSNDQFELYACHFYQSSPLPYVPSSLRYGMLQESSQALYW